MHGDRTERRARRLIAGAMIAGPVLIVVGDLVHPEDDGDPARQLAIVRENLDAWVWAHVVVLAGLMLLVPAVFGLVRYLRHRTPGLALWAGGLSMVGIMALVGLVATDGFMLWLMGQPERDLAEMAAVWDDAQESAPLGILFMSSLGFAIGHVIFAAGLFRSQSAAQWVPPALVIGAVLGVVSRPAGLKTGVILAEVLLLLTYAWFALQLVADDGHTDRSSAEPAAP